MYCPTQQTVTRLLVLFFSTIIILLLGSLGLLPPHTARTSTTEWRSQRDIDMLLGIKTDDERGNVDYLLSNTVYPRISSIFV
jgi:hypothetical protein